jgi:hypothetical protein
MAHLKSQLKTEGYEGYLIEGRALAKQLRELIVRNAPSANGR